MTAPFPESRRPRILWGIAVGVVVLMLFVAFLRRSSAPPKRQGDEKNAQATADAQLQRQLKATLDGLRPERMNVSSSPQSLVGDLNLWWVDYSKTGDVANADTFAATIKDWLGDEAAASVGSGRFNLRDVAHVRDALLFRAMAASLAAGGENDRRRVEAAFEQVVRQISPLPGSASTIPLGAFEVLLVGRGAAEDRIWVFAEILRQLGIDCVVIEPKSPAADAPLPPRLVGAIVKGEGVLLFDPQLGLPVPPPDDTTGALPTRTVTLSEAKQNDALLRQFDVPDGPAYPWTSAALGAVNVRFIIDSAATSPRMLALQTALPAEFTATLFDGPARSSDSPSLRDRIVAAGKDGDWSAESVSAWKYPEQQLTAFFATGAEESPEVRNVMATQYGPRIISKRTINGVDTDVEQDSPHPLRVVRIQHLRGDLLPALTAYVQIFSAPLELGNSEVRADANHWMAVCQEELQRYDAAVNTLNLSLRTAPNGLWSSPSKSALARCEALRGNLPRAIELLSPANAGQSPKLADAYLTRRWQAQTAAPATASGESR